MSTNLFFSGQYYSGEYLRRRPEFTFKDAIADARQAIFVEIEEWPVFDSLVFTLHVDVDWSQQTAGRDEFAYYQIDDGSFTASFSPPQPTTPSTTKPFGIRRVDTWPTPSYYVFVDETGTFRYLTSDTTTPALVVSGTEPAQFGKDRSQFIGEYLDMISIDGERIYRVTINSSDQIVITLNRTESHRLSPVRISQGHPSPFRLNNQYKPAEITIEDIQSSLPVFETGYGGVSIPRLGGMSFSMALDEFDYLASEPWHGRAISVFAGPTTSDPDVYEMIYKGTCETASWTENRFRIALSDISTEFDKAVQENTYAGTGGSEGSSDIEGVLKPKALGSLDLVTPVLIDQPNNVYQVNDGPMHSINFVFQGGIALNNAGNITALGLSSVFDWVPTQANIDNGDFITDLSTGLFRLAAPPGGIVTASIFGSTAVPLRAFASDILRAVIEERLPDVDIDQNSFDEFTLRLAQKNPSFGWYITTPMSINELASELIGNIGGIVAVTTTNRVYLRWADLSRSPVATLTQNDIVDGSISRQPPPGPASIYQINYRRSWTVYTETDYLLAAGQFIRDFGSHEYRSVKFQPTHPSVREFFNRKTVIYNLATVTKDFALDIRIFFLARDFRLVDVYNITIENFSFQLEIGDVILLQYGRWALDGAPRPFLIVGIREISPTSSSENKTALTLWG